MVEGIIILKRTIAAVMENNNSNAVSSFLLHVYKCYDLRLPLAFFIIVSFLGAA